MNHQDIHNITFYQTKTHFLVSSFPLIQHVFETWFKIPAQYMLVFRCLCSCLCWAWCLMLNVTSMLTLKLHWGWCCCWYLHCSCRRSWCWILQRLRLFLPNSICYGWVWWAPFICSLVLSIGPFLFSFLLALTISQLSKAKDFQQNIDRVKVSPVRNKNWTSCQNSRIYSFLQLRIQPAHKGLWIQHEIRWIKVFVDKLQKWTIG